MNAVSEHYIHFDFWYQLDTSNRVLHLSRSCAQKGG